MDDKQKDEYIAQLESIIAMMPGNVYWKSRDGKYLGCNDNLLNIAKLNLRTDLVGKTLTEIMDEKLAAPLLAVDQEILETGKEKCLEEIGPDLNGSLAVYLTKKVPLRNSLGEVIGLVGISFDISERKKLELELDMLKQQAESKAELSNTYLKNIIDNMPENIYWVNKEGIVLGCNDNQAKLFGFSNSNDLIGKTIYDVVELLGWDRSIADMVRQHDLEVMKTEQESIQEEIATLNGEQRTFLSYKKPMKDDAGKIIGITGITVDITERKKIEKELQLAKECAEAANKAKSEFLAMVSHELRIPLTGMLGMAQLMQTDDDLAEIHREEANDIIKSGDHLLALVDGLLDISKLEANKMQLHLTAIDLKELIEDVVSMLAPKAKQKSLLLEIDYEENIPHLVFSDACAIRQILLNLVGNAIKFTKIGHILIRLTCLSQSSSEAKLVLTVEDTGIGILADKLESIFERFNQADTSITRQYGGTGLGLAICKGYIKLMNGTINVESEIGKGSKFICTIPVRLQQATIAASL